MKLYTEKERRLLDSYHSQDYLPPHSKVYRNWLRKQPHRMDLDQWLMMGLIGFSVGIVGFLLHQIIDLISEFKWSLVKNYIREDNLSLAWLVTLSYSLAFLIPATLLVMYQPAAAGSGIPEIIAFLNGTTVKHIFKLKTLVVKFFSCAFAVGCGMPVGFEGPMIHLGSLIAAGLSQFKSSTFGCILPCFSRFRNSGDRRNFISAGAAAGVASAFGAPVGGLLFAMEEVSSFWDHKLSWQVFFCCMTATFTTDLLNSSFHSFKYKGGGFGLLNTHVITGSDLIVVNVIAIVPAVFMGICGGVLGSAFTQLNLLFVRSRKTIMDAVKDKTATTNIIKLVEPVIILCLMTTIHIFFPNQLGCTPVDCNYGIKSKGNSSMEPMLWCINNNNNNSNNNNNNTRLEVNLEAYTCPLNDTMIEYNSVYRKGSYSESATLFFGTGERAVHRLLSKNTHRQFTYSSLCTMLVIHFFMSCWAAGTYIASGMVIPMLLIGGLYGRIVGCMFVDLFGINTSKYWAWLDPGSFALLGAVSFFGGVSRLTISLTVIMVEMTNDIHQLLLIMVTIMVAKWTGDFLSPPLYHALIEFKCIPYLDHEPAPKRPDGSTINLELFMAKHVMVKPVKTVSVFSSVNSICQLLLGCNHSSFPVVKKVGTTAAGAGDLTFVGEISRQELSNIMMRPELFLQKHSNSSSNHFVASNNSINMHPHYKLSKSQKGDKLAPDEHLKNLRKRSTYDEFFVNLSPYINDSAVSVSASFSLHRAYLIFRKLGLRHMTVVSETNQVEGILTRKDLMGFAIGEKLEVLLRQQSWKMQKALEEEKEEEEEGVMVALETVREEEDEDFEIDMKALQQAGNGSSNSHASFPTYQ